MMMKLIARSKGEPTDTSRVHVLTDWNALDAELLPFFEGLERAEAKPREAAARVDERRTADQSGIYRIRHHVGSAVSTK